MRRWIELSTPTPMATLETMMVVMSSGMRKTAMATKLTITPVTSGKRLQNPYSAERKDSEAIERDEAWIPEGAEHSAFDVEGRKKRRQMICKNLWGTAVINWDGSVLPCCAVYGERYAFGNVFQEPFRSIWNNEMYQMARREIKNKLENSHTICHICKENGFLHF